MLYPFLNAEDCSLRPVATAALGGRATGDVAVAGDAAGLREPTGRDKAGGVDQHYVHIGKPLFKIIGGIVI